MKRLLVLVLALAMAFSTSTFALSWVKRDNLWYVLDEVAGDYLKGVVIDTGENVYYLDDSGRMVVGWWRNSKTNKYYFFSNKDNKDYGGMVFGLHVIDGYYRYFNDDGSLATSDKKGDYKKVYRECYADSNGLLYTNNELMRDVTIAKSEYYSNDIYYRNNDLNNYYLAHNDTSFGLFEIDHSQDDAGNNASRGNRQGGTTRERVKTGSDTSGGVNYSVDDHGSIHLIETETALSDLERIGPSANMGTERKRNYY